MTFYLSTVVVAVINWFTSSRDKYRNVCTSNKLMINGVMIVTWLNVMMKKITGSTQKEKKIKRYVNALLETC